MTSQAFDPGKMLAANDSFQTHRGGTSLGESTRQAFFLRATTCFDITLLWKMEVS
jgi:hypothetical protein